MQIRLQKIIAQAGISSRRKAEDLIRTGAVTVNGKTVCELGSKADPDKDHIKVNGKLITNTDPKVYILLHKPKGVVTTLSDPQGRPTVNDLLRGMRVRVFPVGRLDYDSEGLLLLTNNGAMAHLLMHPRYEVPKTYLVKIKGILTDEEISKLRKGFTLPGGRMAHCKIEKHRKAAANSWVQVVLYEGQKRQIRRMMEKLDHTVVKLKRVRLATLELGDLAPGKYRHLLPEELKSLKEFIKKRQLMAKTRTRTRSPVAAGSR
jgi:23S rRNA pseudouridine2605 synthase